MKEENTELVKTGGIFYKIQNFFKKIFNKKNKEQEKEDINKIMSHINSYQRKKGSSNLRGPENNI